MGMIQITLIFAKHRLLLYIFDKNLIDESTQIEYYKNELILQKVTLLPEEIQNDPVVLQAVNNYLSIFGLTKPIKRNLTYGITKNVESIPSVSLRKGFDLDEFNMSKIFGRGSVYAQSSNKDIKMFGDSYPSLSGTYYEDKRNIIQTTIDVLENYVLYNYSQKQIKYYYRLKSF